MEKEWWEPVETNDEWLERIRKDYPQFANMGNEWLRLRYANGHKYQVLWDTLNEAYQQFEMLADVYVKLLKEKE